MGALGNRLAARHGLARRAAMHPGSGDRDVWPIEQQRELFALLGDVTGAVGVELTDTCLMLPNKTVSGVFYAAEVEFVTCALCHRAECPNRRAEFDEALWNSRMEGAGADDHGA